MYKFKIWLLYKKEKLFCAKAGLLNFNIILTLVELEMVGSRLVSNGLIFYGNSLIKIQLVTLLLLSNVSKLDIGANTKIF